MRPLSMASVFALFLSSSALAASSFDSPHHDDDGWNRWECYAYGHYGHSYEGYSDWFRAGSGYGQQAHQKAYDRAMWKCNRWSYGYSCSCDFYQNCRVIRH